MTSLTDSAALLARRGDYPIVTSSLYLANHTLAPMHRDTPIRLAEFADLWAREGVAAWSRWAPEVTAAADTVAGLIGAPAGSVVMRSSVADAVASVISSLTPTPSRNRVVYPARVDWPGSGYLFAEYARLGFTPAPVEICARPDDPGTTADVTPLLGAIDERTALVYLSAVLFRTATLLDVAAVARAAHAAGAVVICDAYQAAGAVPVDVGSWGVDFCVGGSVKYLCGGPGAAWLYVRPGIELRPAATGWWAHAEPFAFDVGPMRHAEGAPGWASGTPPVAAAYAALPGYRALADVGIAAVRARSLVLTRRLIDNAQARGWAVISPSEDSRRGGHVTLAVGDPDLPRELAERRVFCDYRPGAGLRAAPHFFTEDGEIDAFCSAVEQVLAARRQEPGRPQGAPASAAPVRAW